MSTTIYFTTNRLLDAGEFTDGFHPNLDELRAGTVEFDGTELYKKDEVKLAPKGKISVYSEKMNPSDASLLKGGTKELFADIREAMREAKSAILFIHGYNFTFRESAARAAQVQQWLADGGHDCVMLLFAWPSAGAGVAPRTYSDDRARAAASGLALARAILKGADYIRNTPKGERCDTPIHLMAHSMGNWALRGAMQAMRTYVGSNIPPLFDEVLLMAADEDDDTLVLAHKMAPLLRGCRRVTAYYNHQDKALKGSDIAMGNPDRLGRSGPKDVANVPKISALNVSGVVFDGHVDPSLEWQADGTGHQYYRHNPIVRKDVVQVLASKLDKDIDGRSWQGTYWRIDKVKKGK